MAVCYIEEEVWKCPTHPSRRRSNGICPSCLRDRLVSLCSNCGNIRPCTCTASSSSRVSNLIDGEPSFRRSRSVAIPSFIRSHTPKVKTPSFFKRSLMKKNDERVEKKNEDAIIVDKNNENFDRIEDFSRMITRSRSVSVGTTTFLGSRPPEVAPSASKSKFWNFPSPMKVFRSSKNSMFFVQDRSPLHRG